MKIAVIDFVSRYSKDVEDNLIRAKVEYRFFPHDVKADDIKEYDAMIFTGSPDTVYDGGKLPDMSLLQCGKPIFGVCYGHQIVHYLLGGEVRRSNTPEKGVIEIKMLPSKLFKGLPEIQKVEMNHNDEVVKLADGFVCTATEDNCRYAASENVEKNIYTVQFHPEAETNDYGFEIYQSFLRIVDEK